MTNDECHILIYATNGKRGFVEYSDDSFKKEVVFYKYLNTTSLSKTNPNKFLNQLSL
jgi:hypothetical protein